MSLSAVFSAGCISLKRIFLGARAQPYNGHDGWTYDLTARYVHAQAWWELLFRQDVLQNVLAILGIGISLSLVGGSWFRSRKRRDIVKTFLAEIDDVHSRFKTDPKKCEEELYRLRNTVLEGLTQGKISEENYDIIDRKLDKYVSEISKEKESKGGAEPTSQ